MSVCPVERDPPNRLKWPNQGVSPSTESRILKAKLHCVRHSHCRKEPEIETPMDSSPNILSYAMTLNINLLKINMLILSVLFLCICFLYTTIRTDSSISNVMPTKLTRITSEFIIRSWVVS